MPERKLVLHKETLLELSDDELRRVAGAAPWTPSCPLIIELHERLSEIMC